MVDSTRDAVFRVQSSRGGKAGGSEQSLGPRPWQFFGAVSAERSLLLQLLPQDQAMIEVIISDLKRFWIHFGQTPNTMIST